MSAEPDPADPAPSYVVQATLMSPNNRVIGMLEAPWKGNQTISELCTMLVSTSKEREDLDQCRIVVRWRQQQLPG